MEYYDLTRRAGAHIELKPVNPKLVGSSERCHGVLRRQGCTAPVGVDLNRRSPRRLAAAAARATRLPRAPLAALFGHHRQPTRPARLLPLGGLLFALLFVLPGCATVQKRKQARADLSSVLARAGNLEGHKRVSVGGKKYRNDCTGFVTACYGRVPLDLIAPGTKGKSGTELMFRTLKSRGRIVPAGQAKPGDIVFFHNTWDKNGNGLRDDRFTHVALVVEVDSDGRLQVLHYASGKVKRGYMHPKRRGEARDKNSRRVLNSHVRRGRGRTLMGQLMFAIGRPLPR